MDGPAARHVPQVRDRDHRPRRLAVRPPARPRIPGLRGDHRAGRDAPALADVGLAGCAACGGAAAAHLAGGMVVPSAGTVVGSLTRRISCNESAW